MGNKESHNQVGLEHPKLKDAIITPAKKIIKTFKISENYESWKKRYNQIVKLNTSSSLFIPLISQTQHQNFCGSQKQLKLIYDLYPFTLHQQIKKRSSMNQAFSQAQLWYLLYQLVMASAIFQQKKQKSGDIRPSNILLNQKGHISVISSISFPNELTNYYKSLIFKQRTYLAPQELAQLQKGEKYCKSQQVLGESWSIGLTMIDAALLVDLEQVYQLQSNISFKNYLYNDNLVQFKSASWTPFFIKTSFDRPSPGETLAILKPYEQEILNLEEFIPDRQKSKASLENFQQSTR